eukprot:764439-Hanusia_phi.AAC.2
MNGQTKNIDLRPVHWQPALSKRRAAGGGRLRYQQFLRSPSCSHLRLPLRPSQSATGELVSQVCSARGGPHLQHVEIVGVLGLDAHEDLRRLERFAAEAACGRCAENGGRRWNRRARAIERRKERGTRRAGGEGREQYTHIREISLCSIDASLSVAAEPQSNLAALSRS